MKNRTKKTQLYTVGISQNRRKVQCNICNTAFHPHSLFERFCPSCRKSSRVFKLSEWLPEHALYF